jgi:hypothetical protein
MVVLRDDLEGGDLRARIRQRLTYANVVGTLVLFAVLAGGTALALPGKHRVKADDFRKNSVRARAIGTGAVGTDEIKNGAVGRADISNGGVTGADIADRGLTYQDLGSNSVVARVRNSAAVSSGDGGSGNPASVPLSGNTWTQAANEIDVFFGQLTFTQPATCSGMNPRMIVALVVDGNQLTQDVYSVNPGQTATGLFADARPFLFEPGTATARTVTVRVFDTCTGAGENFALDAVEVNAVAIR